MSGNIYKKTSLLQRVRNEKDAERVCFDVSFVARFLQSVLVLLSLTSAAHAFSAPADSTASDPRNMGWMEGFPPPVAVSSRTGEGVDALQLFIREQLFGASVSVSVFPPPSTSSDASERIVSEVYDRGMVDHDRRETDGTTRLDVWMTQACQAQLKARWADRIDIK